ncbi:hypothetical protein NDI49_28590 [Trichocoleus sp. ST-U3]
MQKNKLQILHCNCGMLYVSKGRILGNKMTCSKCGRTPQIEQLKLASFSSKTIPSRSTLLKNYNQFTAIFLTRRMVLTAVSIASLLGMMIYLPRTQPQGTQLSTVPVSLKSVPKPSPNRPPVSLPNGTDIIPPQDLQGFGKLKIINGTTRDAAVKLVDSVSGKTRRFVYVQANRETSVANISPCTCQLKFTMGTDWEQKTQKFLQNPSFSQFSNPLNFKEIKKEAGVEWMEYRATLHPVPHGSARTKQIDASDFEEK